MAEYKMMDLTPEQIQSILDANKTATSSSPNIMYDEQGRPYTMIGGTNQRSYISPVAMGGAKPSDSGGGMFKTDLKWDSNKGEWTRDWDWQNIGSLAVGGLAGGAVAAGLAGASAPATTGTLASHSVLPASGAPLTLPAATTGIGPSSALLASTPISQAGAPATLAGATSSGSPSLLGKLAASQGLLNYGKDSSPTQPYQTSARFDSSEEVPVTNREPMVDMADIEKIRKLIRGPRDFSKPNLGGPNYAG